MIAAMTQKKTSLAYKFIKAMVRLFSPDYEYIGTDKLPDEPVVLVGNHCQMFGPIAAEVHPIRQDCIWCAGQMMILREVPSYAFGDFWSQKPASVRWLFRIASYLIAPLAVIVFCNARTIPVYRDRRLAQTFRLSLDALEEGADVVIFPEHDVPHNNVVYDFQERFIDLARFYYKRTGRPLSFVPVYYAPKLGKAVIGSAVSCDPKKPFSEERARIRSELMAQLTEMARALPPHTVVPYRNIPKKYYPLNTDTDWSPEGVSGR